MNRVGTGLYLVVANSLVMIGNIAHCEYFGGRDMRLQILIGAPSLLHQQPNISHIHQSCAKCTSNSSPIHINISKGLSIILSMWSQVSWRYALLFPKKIACVQLWPYCDGNEVTTCSSNPLYISIFVCWEQTKCFLVMKWGEWMKGSKWRWILWERCRERFGCCQQTLLV